MKVTAAATCRSQPAVKIIEEPGNQLVTSGVALALDNVDNTHSRRGHDRQSRRPSGPDQRGQWHDRCQRPPALPSRHRRRTQGHSSTLANAGTLKAENGGELSGPQYRRQYQRHGPPPTPRDSLPGAPGNLPLHPALGADHLVVLCAAGRDRDQHPGHCRGNARAVALHRRLYAEIVRGGVNSIERGQWDAARAIGMRQGPSDALRGPAASGQTDDPAVS